MHGDAVGLTGGENWEEVGGGGGGGSCGIGCKLPLTHTHHICGGSA